MSRRRRSMADTVTVLADAISSAALAALTPQQRASLTSEDTGTIVRHSIDVAQKIGALLEQKEARNA